MATKKVTGKELKGDNAKNKIILDGMEYDITLDLNAFAELEEIYGDVTEALDGLEKGSFKAIRAILFAILKSQNDKLTLVKVANKLNMTAEQSLPELTEEAIEEKND